MSPNLTADISRRLLALMEGWQPDMQDMVLAVSESLDETRARPAVLSTGAVYSTVLSRCARNGLPSPKLLHRHLRLYVFLVLAGRGDSVGRLAEEMCASSPQALGRSIRVLTGKGARRFAATDPESYWTAFVNDVLRPTAPGWRWTSRRSKVAA